MNRFQRTPLGITLLLVLVALAALAAPLAAQEAAPMPSDFPTNTITVTGMGTVLGRPDIANLELGVEISGPDVAATFTEVNTTIDAVIAAVVAAGVAAEDIQTTGLDIFTEGMFGPMDGQTAQERTYRVSNRIRVTVRDIAAVGAVVNAAVSAGANSLFGLTFGIDDRATLESQARAAAMEDARARATELAALAGGTLGEVIIIDDGTGDYFTGYAAMSNRAEGLGGGASIEPGSLSVSASLRVTFRLLR